MDLTRLWITQLCITQLWITGLSITGLGAQPWLLPRLAPVVVWFLIEQPLELVLNPATELTRVEPRSAPPGRIAGARTRSRNPIDKLPPGFDPAIQALLEAIVTTACHGRRLPAAQRQAALQPQAHHHDGKTSELQGPQEHVHSLVTPRRCLRP